jgi:hypothetical protein
MGHRESLLTFIGADLVAARWNANTLIFTSAFGRTADMAGPAVGSTRSRK